MTLLAPDVSTTSATVLVALYLRGAPRRAQLSRRRWPCVDGALRRAGCGLDGAAQALRREGLWPEALCLEEPGLLAWAEDRVQGGHVLTPSCEGYPPRWLARLRATAPPALWRCGSPPARPLVAVVGTRVAPPEALAFARSVAGQAVRDGLGIVSGGAVGCDSAAAEAAPHASLEILPHGLAHRRHDRPHDRPCVSLCEPSEPFSAASAMERNALIYAAAEAAVVADARLREGGTWTGATDALRRRLCPLIARHDPASPGLSALIALGAVPLAHAGALSDAMARPYGQSALPL